MEQDLHPVPNFNAKCQHSENTKPNSILIVQPTICTCFSNYLFL